MFSFIDFYINRDVYKEYISPSIIYLLDLSYQKNISEYDISGKEDSLAEILAIAAIQELKKDEMMNFYYIITDARFNDTCVKNLFKLFFKNEKEKTTTNIENMNLVFSELLNNSFFNFSYIFENDERENYCGYIKNDKKNLKILINYLSENQIYFYSLYNFLKGIKDKKISIYIKQCKKQKYIYEIMHGDRNDIKLFNREYVGEYLGQREKATCLMVYDKIAALQEKLKNTGLKNKSIIAIKIISIGFAFPYKIIIGGKLNYVEDKNSINYHPNTPYYDKYPLFFNNPVKMMKECIDSLNISFKTNLTDEEKKEICDVFYDIYDLIYKELNNE